MKIDYIQIQKDADLKPVLVKTKEIQYEYDIEFTRPQDIAAFMNEEFAMDKLLQEEFYALLLTATGRPLAIILLSKGSTTSLTIDAGSLFRAALLSSAIGVVLIHNHPSGNPVPSQCDRETTAKIQQGCELLSLILLDHIIIGEGYVSFREKALL